MSPEDILSRLLYRAELMSELEKMVRVMKKLDPAAPHAVLLVLDATTGQNALSQIEVFKQIAGVTGLIMTKLDGTARGGVLVAAAEKYGLPIHAIGVGETIDDPVTVTATVTAFTGLGQVLTAGLVLVLLTWWATHWRSRRRAALEEVRGRHPSGAQ